MFIGHLYFISRGQHHSSAIWLQRCLMQHSVADSPNQMSKQPPGKKHKGQIFLNVKSTDCVWSLETVQKWCSYIISAERDAGSGWRVSLVLHGVHYLSVPSSSTAEAAQGHERLEVKWRPLLYPPWKPSHALSSTWGIWWKPFVSMPLNYQQQRLMLPSDNGSQQPADSSAH